MIYIYIYRIYDYQELRIVCVFFCFSSFWVTSCDRKMLVIMNAKLLLLTLRLADLQDQVAGVMSKNEKRRLNDMICIQDIVWTHLCGFDILDILQNINGFILLLFHSWPVIPLKSFVKLFNSTAAKIGQSAMNAVPWTPRKVIAEDAWASASRTFHMFLSWVPLRLSIRRFEKNLATWGSPDGNMLWSKGCLLAKQEEALGVYQH